MLPVEINEILIDRHYQALLANRVRNDSRIFFTGYTQVFGRINVSLIAEKSAKLLPAHTLI